VAARVCVGMPVAMHGGLTGELLVEHIIPQFDIGRGEVLEWVEPLRCAESAEHYIMLLSCAFTDGAKLNALSYPVEGVQLLRHPALTGTDGTKSVPKTTLTFPHIQTQQQHVLVLGV